jgi:asparagine synthase (glutamine-hydrolysing)
MCGLAGFWDPRRVLPADALPVIGRRMGDCLAHRGPDDQGTWVDADASLVLAHRRLAILDRGPAGHQPMHSRCGRYVIAFNGEIYNHMALRAVLESEGAAPGWRGHSDTETLLACIAAWGVDRAIRATVGMFAIALWDRRERTLVLARDRLGEKPLYYGWHHGAFLFGSELRALMAFPGFRGRIDRGALALLLRRNCVPAPHSIIVGIRKLPPGSLLRLRCEDDTRSDTPPEPEHYWRLADAVVRGRADPLDVGDDEAVSLLDEVLGGAIAGQMIADVPLGAFLSGGIDSSLVVALMQARATTSVRTFTIGFGGGGYDESAHAREVAAHLVTEHTELEIGSADALQLIPRLPEIYCEPFGDSSQIPTLLVSQLARTHVAVALSGDGGDEVFGGYNRYLGALGAWRRMQGVPPALRRTLAGMITALPPAKWDSVARQVAPLLPARMRIAMPGEKAHKLASVLPLEHQADYYRALTSHWSDPASIVIGAEEPAQPVVAGLPGDLDTAEWMMAMDTLGYLPDDILAKVDRAAMANSLETRVPFLDHRVVEFAWRLPLRMRVRDGVGKWLPRRLLERHLPRSAFDRPKMGFGVPLDGWLRGALRPWAEALLDPGRLRRQGLFHPEPIQRMWLEHLGGRRNRQYHLWTILMFQAWLLAHEDRLSLAQED